MGEKIHIGCLFSHVIYYARKHTPHVTVSAFFIVSSLLSRF